MAVEPKLDWLELPPALRYVAPLAERYGHIQFPDQIDDFIKNGTEAEKAELAALAKRLWKDSEDGRNAIAWTLARPLTSDPASARVHFLLVLLNELGLA